MLTLKKFEALAASYGAELRRWPEVNRAEAEALVRSSERARAILAAARRLDRAIGAASDEEEARLWNGGERDAALARLRSTVAARITASPAHSSVASRPESAWAAPLAAVPFRLGWVGILGMSGIVVAAGLFIGLTYGSSGGSDRLLSFLQPNPIEIFVD